MKLALKNYMRVRDAATTASYDKKGLARYMFTVGEVVKLTGLTRNTVNKYVGQMKEDGIICDVVVSASLTAYRFGKDYVQGFKADRLNKWEPM